MDFLDDQHLFVTERGGNLYLVNLLTGERNTIANVPTVQATRQGGMLDVAVHQNPDDDSVTVYLCYSLLIGDKTVTAIDKAKFGGIDLTDRQTIFKANNQEISAIHYGCRLVLNDGYLYASLGERGQRHKAQDPKSHAGAIIRLNEDGSIPDNNTNLSNWAPEIISKGHRNPQGLTYSSFDKKIYASNHGARGGDWFGEIKKGENYGWKILGWGGTNYSGLPIGPKWKPGFTKAIKYWVPSIAASAITIYKGQEFKSWEGHALITSLKDQSLRKLIFKDLSNVKEDLIFKNKIGRIRDIQIHPKTGKIYFLSEDSLWLMEKS